MVTDRMGVSHLSCLRRTSCFLLFILRYKCIYMSEPYISVKFKGGITDGFFKSGLGTFFMVSF